ncbi:DNA alkylation repair protein [Streptococcus mitis]|uniref:DNA alkylation repair protein n=2 Tax=Streptococcus TaxID=1301 RepID=A0A2N6P3M2_STROR|nr:DNA alkylation repair protein [Streptococcus mitis]PMB85301.1 DNA alkylation repair protein [Streptococcus oralis subsp. dentisani]
MRSSFRDRERFSFVFFFVILFENLFKPRQFYLQPQSCALSNLRIAS